MSNDPLNPRPLTLQPVNHKMRRKFSCPFSLQSFQFHPCCLYRNTCMTRKHMMCIFIVIKSLINWGSRGTGKRIGSLCRTVNNGVLHLKKACSGKVWSQKQCPSLYYELLLTFIVLFLCKISLFGIGNHSYFPPVHRMHWELSEVNINIMLAMKGSHFQLQVL